MICVQSMPCHVDCTSHLTSNSLHFYFVTITDYYEDDDVDGGGGGRSE